MGMKLHFDPGLDYQLAAVDAVCDIFAGQGSSVTEFFVSPSVNGAGQGAFAGWEEHDHGALGIGNRLTLNDDQISSNLRAVQIRNGLSPSEQLKSGDFTVEMETGTGKTYVYLRTVFEMNKRFGFSKFIIVVPSIAIKEGVYKTLQITHDHFRGLYAGQPVD